MNNHIMYIIIHHTERNNDFPAFVRFRHRHLRGWDDVGYHYLIGNKRPFTKDGHLYVGRQEKCVGAHALGYNNRSLGVCLIGNISNTNPSSKQLQTLVSLLREKTKQYQIPVQHILGHCELPNVEKSCPGDYLDMVSIRQAVTGQIELSALLAMSCDKFVPSLCTE